MIKVGDFRVIIDNCSMPHDPARLADARQWLRKADEDLKAAKQLLKAAKPLIGRVPLPASGREGVQGLSRMA